MRRVFVVLHRWFGLFTAVFLFVAGFTGAIISWDHELDEWLNPALFQARSGSAHPVGPSEALALVEGVERSDPRVRVKYSPLNIAPTRTLQLSVEPRIDPATKRPFDLGFNQLAVDPENGHIQGRRMWGEVSLARENLLPFLYKLHYTMHIPDAFGVELGMLFMGIVAIVWVLDCFIALWLSFPSRKTWSKSFAFRLRGGGARLTFDLHRSGGVWAWVLLLTLAVTAVSMNLNAQVVRPLVSLFSTLSKSPFESRTPNPPDQPIEPVITPARAIELSRVEAHKRGIAAPAGGIFYASNVGVYGVGFFAPGLDHGDGGLGNPWLHVDARDGHSLGAEIPGQGSAGDVFMQAQFPLHSGRLLGLPGRLLVSFLGLVVAMLSVTGVLIWARKQRARARLALQRGPGPAAEHREAAVFPHAHVASDRRAAMPSSPVRLVLESDQDTSEG
jgi:uncharacterized iron-regulated membrane protein